MPTKNANDDEYLQTIRLGISIDDSATLSNPVATIGVYESHSDRRTTLQQFLVNTQAKAIRVVDALMDRSIS